ncbi:hypothetical protein EYF80_037696 [Liparis tanakae]|uniref:Uncharacterized protein n=1 Tax=Liparis tanakae TaxID=230148 RepID=A0A4Z2GEW7_9TELE|nr:hypothetical protein EYF80_037696 [Liparis tanakae]
MLCEAPFTAAAAAASAAAFSKAIVWDLGRRPRTPLRTGRGGKGLGSRYEVCMEDEEQLDDERRAARETDVEDTGAWSALGRRTPADGEDVSGVEGAPIVKGASPAVKHDKDLLTSDLSNCGGTNQVPIGWMFIESTSLQKSLVLSLPSRRKRRRVPIMPITVAMHKEFELRGLEGVNEISL